MKKNILPVVYTIRYAIFVILFLQGCVKEMLDSKPDKSLVIPATIRDFQVLLDNSNMNQDGLHIAEIAGGDFYWSYEDWNSQTAVENRTTHIWESHPFRGVNNVLNWNNPYNRIFVTNVVLEGIEKVSPNSSNQEVWNSVKGTALYLRGHHHYNVASLFAKPYIAGRAADELGIPLRIKSDINAPVFRANLENTYRQILDDFKHAATLLPMQQDYVTRPTKLTAWAMLARVYLSMEEYEEAFTYADSCLIAYPFLMDYNELDTLADFPVPATNEELLIRTTQTNVGAFRKPILKMDLDLIRSYEANDLRKQVFFHKNPDDSYSFKGSYNNSVLFSPSVAVDELYLIRAECAARMNRPQQAIGDLNTLLQTRYKTQTYIPFNASDAGEALRLVLRERRKELVMRALRWQDLKRLNRDPRFQTTLSRHLNGEIYSLPPNDPRYVFPIPDYVIDVTGMEQNNY